MPSIAYGLLPTAYGDPNSATNSAAYTAQPLTGGSRRVAGRHMEKFENAIKLIAFCDFEWSGRHPTGGHWRVSLFAVGVRLFAVWQLLNLSWKSVGLLLDSAGPCW